MVPCCSLHNGSSMLKVESVLSTVFVALWAKFPALVFAICFRCWTVLLSIFVVLFLVKDSLAGTKVSAYFNLNLHLHSKIIV